MSAEGNAPGAPGSALSAPVVLAVLVAALGYFVDIFDLLLFGLVRTRSLTEVLAPQIAELPARFAAELAACADQEARQRVLDIATASLLKEWGGWLDNVLQTTGLMLGGLVWGVLGDRRGRLSVLFGSILCYSVANLLNGFITDVRVDGPLGFLHAVGLGSAIRQYEVLRFLAGFGLAGELGAGITLVAELVKPEQRGIATTVVATVGILGAVVGYFVTRWTGWREAFWIGGALGLGLLVLRIGVVESGMFRKVQARHERGRGAFWLLAWPPERLGRYLGIVLAAVPIWFVVGTLTKYSDVLGMSMGMPASERPDPAAAIMWCYMGLAAGDFASGRPLSYAQDEVQFNGHAIECRVNAEDPYNNFMPSTGRITHSLLPTGPGVRVDTGVYPGFEITPFYDPMIAKLIVWGETRAQAILRMRRALEEYRIVGVRTNIPFHQTMMDSHRFMGGQYDTRFVEERFSMEDAEENRQDFSEVAAILATLVEHHETEVSSQFVQRNKRDASNWRWVSRWERMHR